MEHKTQRLL